MDLLSVETDVNWRTLIPFHSYFSVMLYICLDDKARLLRRKKGSKKVKQEPSMFKIVLGLGLPTLGLGLGFYAKSDKGRVIIYLSYFVRWPSS